MSKEHPVRKMKTCLKNSVRVSFTRWKRVTCALLCLALMTTAVLCAAAPAEKDGRTVRVGWYDSSFNIMDEFGRRTGYGDGVPVLIGGGQGTGPLRRHRQRKCHRDAWLFLFI